jgi:hypothetical protein
MTIEAEQDLIDSLERQIEEFHELRKRCGRVSQQVRWPLPGSSPGAANAEAPAVQRSSSPA